MGCVKKGMHERLAKEDKGKYTTYRRKRMTKTMSEVSCKGRTPSSMGLVRRACSSSRDSSGSGDGGATGGVAIV